MKVALITGITGQDGSHPAELSPAQGDEHQLNGASAGRAARLDPAV